MHLLNTHFIDRRGKISNIVAGDYGDIGGVQVIETKAGSVRANHWHRQDWHVLHIISGHVRYYEREVGSNAQPLREVYGPGQTIETGPRLEHALEFLENTIMVSISGFRRGEQEHDAVDLSVDLTKE